VQFGQSADNEAVFSDAIVNEQRIGIAAFADGERLTGCRRRQQGCSSRLRP
jgi:hypothetical protein